MSVEITAPITEKCESIMVEIDADHEKEDKKEEMRFYHV
tara:strand:+ start:524 stop:640 length:117 start_codon:yes stop_codon:yes gene_type:complete